MDSNHSQNLQTCSVCGVSITEEGKVNFSHGSSGTRARLYARVCQYTQKPECINQESQLQDELNPEDGFESGENLLIPFLSNLGATN